MSKGSTIVEKAVADFLLHLRERNSSPHTIKAYTGDLANFSAFAGSRGWKQIDHIAIRGFLSQLYEKGLSKTSVARSLAAVRSLYRWLAQDGIVDQNPAKLVATPKLPKKLPRVPTIEEMNFVLDGKMPEEKERRSGTFHSANPPRTLSLLIFLRDRQFSLRPEKTQTLC
jgi:integrase/recombinase XerC